MEPITFTAKTTRVDFANWLKKYTRTVSEHQYPTDRGHFELQRARLINKNRVVCDAIYFEFLEFKQRLIQGTMEDAFAFDMTRLSNNRVKFEASCNLVVFEAYFVELLGAIANDWPETRGAIQQYLNGQQGQSESKRTSTGMNMPANRIEKIYPRSTKKFADILTDFVQAWFGIDGNRQEHFANVDLYHDGIMWDIRSDHFYSQISLFVKANNDENSEVFVQTWPMTSTSDTPEQIESRREAFEAMIEYLDQRMGHGIAIQLAEADTIEYQQGIQGPLMGHLRERQSPTGKGVQLYQEIYLSIDVLDAAIAESFSNMGYLVEDSKQVDTDAILASLSDEPERATILVERPISGTVIRELRTLGTIWYHYLDHDHGGRGLGAFVLQKKQTDLTECYISPSPRYADYTDEIYKKALTKNLKLTGRLIKQLVNEGHWITTKAGDDQDSSPGKVSAYKGRKDITPYTDALDELIDRIKSAGLGRAPESDNEMAAAWLAWNTIPQRDKPRLETWLEEKFGVKEDNTLNLQSTTFHNYKRKVPAERLSKLKENL
jgi:hypothetical protein